MRRTSLSLYIVVTVVLITILFSSSTGVQVPAVGDTNLGELDKIELPVSLLRLKRQVETFDDEYPTASTEQTTEEEPGFWDRVVKVALKIFNRFIEWLNS